MAELPDLCSDCGIELEEETPGQERPPCPNCGSTRRTKQARAELRAHFRSTAKGQVIYAWDANSLTLAGVIYGIVVTVAAVTMLPKSLASRLVFAGVALGLLAAGLLLFAQPIIAAMRWLLERPKR